MWCHVLQILWFLWCLFPKIFSKISINCIIFLKWGLLKIVVLLFQKKIRKSDYDGHRAIISAFKRLRLEYYHELEASQRSMMKPCLKTNPQTVTSKCKFAPVSLPCTDPQTRSHGEMRLQWESRWVVLAVFTTSESRTHAQLIPARPIMVLTSDVLASSMPLVSIPWLNISAKFSATLKVFFCWKFLKPH